MITQNGISRKPLSQIESELFEKFKAKFTDEIDGVKYTPSVEVESFLGALASVLAEIKDEINQESEDVYYSGFLTTADGVSLDRIALPTERLESAFAETQLSFIGDPDTVVDAGTKFETEDKRQYILQEMVILDEYGLGEGRVLAAEAGSKYNTPENSITFIPQPIDGLDEVTNLEAIVDGTNDEEDPDYRERAIDDRENGITSSLDAIISRVRKVNDVVAVSGRENTTADYLDGIPPGGIEITVRGGLDQDIANAIHAAKPAGNPTYGSVAVTVLDSQGIERTIYFSRVIDVPIYVRVELEVGLAYSETLSNDVVRQAILDYIGGVNPANVVSQGVTIGEAVFAWRAKSTLAVPNMLPGLIDATVKLGTSSGDRTHDEVEVLGTQEAITSFANIDVVIVSS